MLNTCHLTYLVILGLNTTSILKKNQFKMLGNKKEDKEGEDD